MSTPQDAAEQGPASTRRDWLKTVGRYGALAGLLGGIGTLAARTACRQTPCHACPLLARCDLSKALDARAAQQEEAS